MIICHINFKRTENHKITTTNTSQHVEFFHSLIFNTFILVNEKKLQVIAVLLGGCLGIYSVNATPKCTLCYPGVTKGDIGSKCMRYVSVMKEEIP